MSQWKGVFVYVNHCFRRLLAVSPTLPRIVLTTVECRIPAMAERVAAQSVVDASQVRSQVNS